MTPAFLVRHGTTDWNAEGRLQGRSDVRLNEQGRAEARAVARSLAEARVERVVSSPLARARETAEPVAAWHDALLSVDDSWQERSFGSLEGRPANEALAAHPELHPKSGDFAPDVGGDGESARAVAERVRERWPPADGTVVVTHETPLRIALALVEGDEPTAALSRFGFSPGDVITVENGTWQRRSP